MTGRSDIDVVTGAFSYSGASVAAAPPARGRRVRTLTGHPVTTTGSVLHSQWIQRHHRTPDHPSPSGREVAWQ